MTFDLKAAREICPRVKGYEDPDGGNFADFQAAEMLPAALDEIERLQEFRGRIARILGQSISDCDDLLILGLDSRIILTKRQAKRIVEMEERSAKQHAALKKLGKAKRERGKALVEERAKLFHQFGDVELDPPSDIDCKFARDQLRLEGLL